MQTNGSHKPMIDPRQGHCPLGDLLANYGAPPPIGKMAFAAVMVIPAAPTQDPPMINYRNRSLAQPFRLRERIRTGKAVFLVGALLGEPESAK